MCEMLFSYGFIEEATKSAHEIFLEIEIPNDDPLRLAKLHVSRAAPGVTITEHVNGIEWQSDFIWLVCVNEEDGLEFRALQTNDESQELRVFWKHKELVDMSEFHEKLLMDDIWEVFQLRAVAIIQERVENQLQDAYHQIEGAENTKPDGSAFVRKEPFQMATKLRNCETMLLERFYEELETKVW